MTWLLGEIVAGLVVMTLAGFLVGWILRGIHERIKRSRAE